MPTVPEAARRLGRDPETVRRWIRSGKLRSHKVGTQHVIEEEDLRLLDEEAEPDSLPIPEEWKRTFDGAPQLDWVRLVRRDRESH